jgi:molybdopterin synthase catalytic subunit
MSTDTLVDIYNSIADKLAVGDEKGAMETFRARFKELPADVQGAILTRPFIGTVREEAKRVESLVELEKEVIAGIKILEILKEELGKKAA